MSKLSRIVLGVLGVSVIAAIIQDPPKKPKPTTEDIQFTAEALSIAALKAAMKDPSSFELLQVLRMNDGTLCITYRARNSFNALVPGRAVIADGFISLDEEGDRFVNIWNARCGGKKGRDITFIRHTI